MKIDVSRKVLRSIRKAGKEVYRTRSFVAEVKEMQADNFPVAYTISFSRVNAEQEQWVHIPFRADGNKLFCQFRSGLKDAYTIINQPKSATEPNVAEEVNVRVRDREDENAIQESLMSGPDKLRIFDGTIWYATPAPYYTVCGNENKKSYTIDTLDIPVSSWKQNLYWAEEWGLLCQELNGEPDKKQGYIEIGEAFDASSNDLDALRLKRQKEAVREHMTNEVFGGQYMPAEATDAYNAISTLSEHIRERVFGDGLRTSVSSDEFYKAFIDELLALVQPNGEK